MTFGELEQLAQCVAANLLRHGYSASRPVALYMSNCVEMVVLHLAVWRLGGTVASINAMLLPGNVASTSRRLKYTTEIVTRMLYV